MGDKPYNYVAFGRPPFPREMLKHDRATIVKGPLKYAALPRKVQELVINTSVWDFYLLRSPRAPNSERWNSFLWGVIDLNGYTQHGHFDREKRFPSTRKGGNGDENIHSQD